MVRNDSIKHGPVKASIHPVDDYTTREAELESAQIIVNRRVLLNLRRIMLVVIADCLLERLKRRRHIRGMERERKYALLNQIKMHHIVLLN